MSARTKPDPDTAAVPDDPEPLSQTDQMAADAGNPVDGAPPEFPDGVPVLLPLLRIPRRRRGGYFAAMSEVARLQKVASPTRVERVSDKDTPNAIRLSDTADMMNMLAAIEDVLAAVAQDPDALREWAMAAPDAELTQAFNAYIAWTQPGEARSSAS